MERFKQLQYIFKGDRVIWIVFFLLCIISVIEVYSSSSRLGFKNGNYWFAATYHSATLVGGFIAMLVMLNIPCRYFKVFTPIMFLLSIVLLVLVYFIGTKENDAARWLHLGFIPLQPSEIAKGTLVLTTAHILSQLQTLEGVSPKAFKYIMITSLPLIGLVLPENFSTAFMMGLVVYIMMLVGRVSTRQMLRLTLTVVGVAVFFVSMVLLLGRTADERAEQYADVQPKKEFTETAGGKPVAKEEATEEKHGIFKVLHRMDVWKERIVGFTDGTRVSPEKFDMDSHGQEARAQMAIVNADVIGCGPGRSEQRDQLPLAFSDFIYAIIIEEFGILGAIGVPLLYMILLFRTAHIAQKCENTFPALLALGLAMMIVVQALFNMAVAVGLAPVTGQPLPLISKGGTSSIINCVYIGVILSVSRTAKKKIEEPKELINQNS